MTTTTFEQVLMSARQLAPRERARLVAVIVEELAEPTTPTPQPPNDTDAWAQWDALREEFRTIGPVSPTAGEQLDWDRQARDALLMGLVGASDVHA